RTGRRASRLDRVASSPPLTASSINRLNAVEEGEKVTLHGADAYRRHTMTIPGATARTAPSRITDGRREPRHELRVLRAGDPLLQHLEDGGQVAPRQRRRVEPQARKDLALVQARRRECQAVIPAV